MMEAALAAATARGCADRLHVERFGAAASAPAVHESGDHAFEVELRASGQTVEVPADRTLGEVLSDIGAPCTMMCSEGYCGTCVTRVLAGEVDHRDSFLTEDERAEGMMMICTSRARGARLVLDL